MKRLVTSIVAVATLAGGAAACSNPIEPAAATVDGTEVSRKDFMDELRDLADAIAAQRAEDGTAVDPAGAGDGQRIQQELTNSWLSFRVASLLIDQGVERYGLRVETDDLAGAETSEAVSLFVGRNDDLAALNRDRLARAGALDRYLQDTAAAGKDWWSNDDALAVGRSQLLLSANETLDDLEPGELGKLQEALREVTSLDTWLAFENRVRKVSIDRRFGTWDVGGATVVSPAGAVHKDAGDLDLSSLFGG